MIMSPWRLQFGFRWLLLQKHCSAKGKERGPRRENLATFTVIRLDLMKSLWGNTFCPPQHTASEQTEEAFEQRFRIPRPVYSRVCTTVVSHSAYMRQLIRPDATDSMGISPLLKVIFALLTLVYAPPSDLADDMFDVSGTTSLLCLKEFCKSVVYYFWAEYLLSPTTEDLRRIEREFVAVGFPCCIGCLDCPGWGLKTLQQPFKESWQERMANALCEWKLDAL